MKTGIQIFVTMIVFFAASLSSFANPLPGGSEKAAAYHRFFRGFKRADLTPPEFLEKINNGFFTLFGRAVKYGLVSYEPALVSVDSKILPIEVALVSYRSEADYKKYRESEDGKAIGEAHWVVFDQAKSKSVVPVQYEGKIELETAYDFSPSFSNNKNSTIVLVIYSVAKVKGKDFNKNLAKIYKRTQKKLAEKAPSEKRLENVITLVTEDYVMEYLAFDSKTSIKRQNKLIETRKNWFADLYKTSQTILFSAGKPGENKVGFGQGLNAQF